MSAALRLVALACAASASLLTPISCFAQDAGYVRGRLDSLQGQLADLSAKIEQLKAQDRQFQQQIESIRAKTEARLERLEKGSDPAKKKPR